MKYLTNKKFIMSYIIIGATFCSIKLSTLISDVKGSVIKGVSLSIIRLFGWPIFLLKYAIKKLFITIKNKILNK